MTFLRGQRSKWYHILLKCLNTSLIYLIWRWHPVHRQRWTGKHSPAPPCNSKPRVDRGKLQPRTRRQLQQPLDAGSWFPVKNGTTVDPQAHDEYSQPGWPDSQRNRIEKNDPFLPPIIAQVARLLSTTKRLNTKNVWEHKKPVSVACSCASNQLASKHELPII